MSYVASSKEELRRRGCYFVLLVVAKLFGNHQFMIAAVQGEADKLAGGLSHLLLFEYLISS